MKRTAISPSPDSQDELQEEDSGSIKRLWVWWKKFTRHHVIVRTILWCGLLLCFLFWAVFHQLGSIDAQRRQDDARAAALDIYRNEIRTYDLEVANRERCLAQVDTRSTVRAVLFDFAHGFVTILPESGLAQQYETDRINFVNANYPELSVTDCPLPPEFPSPPEGLTDADVQELSSGD